MSEDVGEEAVLTVDGEVDPYTCKIMTGQFPGPRSLFDSSNEFLLTGQDAGSANMDDGLGTCLLDGHSCSTAFSHVPEFDFGCTRSWGAEGRKLVCGHDCL
jgi:hypothetical protein